MADKWSEFFTTYDHLVRDIQQAGGDGISLHLTRWFANLDDEPEASQIVRELEEPIDVASWLRNAAESGNSASMVGGKLPWSVKSSALLGEQIALTRLVASQQIDLQNFIVNYMYVKGYTGADAAASLYFMRVFEPLARDLKRRLKQQLATPPDLGALTVPASDRVVTVDHNNDGFREMVEAIDRVAEAVRGENGFSSAAEKAQAASELAAGKQLLSSPRVRLAAVGAVLLGALAWLIPRFEGLVLGVLGNAAWTAIQAYFKTQGF